MTGNFWEKLKKPIMVAAPMSGVTDEAFRLMLLKYGKPDVFWTEFISVDALFSPKGRKYCLEALAFDKNEHPIVAQVFGGKPEHFEKATAEIEKMGFDGIDINMGCPDRDIEKQGAGSSLIKNPELAKEIIRATKRGTKIPVSVKTRIGYEKNEISEWIPVILQENVAVLTVHFRTKKEMYAAPAHWELAKEVVKLRDKYAPETLIIGNGDVKNLKEAKKLAKETGLDGIMVGRAVLGNPWFFTDKSPTVIERLNAIIEHAQIFNGKHFDSMKKHFHAYAKGFKGAKELRESLMKIKNLPETKEVVEIFLDNNNVV
jgi:nifR3 family TIM-barrel protein